MPLCKHQFFFSVPAKNSLKILCFDYKKSFNYPKFCYIYHLFLTELSVVQLCHLFDYTPKLDLNSVLLPLSDILYDNSAKTWPQILLLSVKNGS